MLRSAFPQPWPMSQSLPLKNPPKAWCWYHHASSLGGGIGLVMSGTWFPLNIIRIEARQLNPVSSDKRILFLKVWVFLRCFFASFTLPEWLMVVLLEVSPISTQDLWSSASVTWSPLLPKAFLPRLLSLERWPGLGSILVLLNFFHSELLRSLGSWHPSMLQNFFCSLPQLYASVAGSSLDLMAWLFLWYRLSAVRPYTDICVHLSKSCLINWVYHRWTSWRWSR